MITINLIGTGRWSEKIAQILSSSRPLKYMPIIHSISEFDPLQFNKSSSEIIWLTLFSESQIDQMDILKNMNVKIIIEKPYYVNLEERSNFLKVINGFEEKFWPSVPWQFGKPWIDFEKNLNLSEQSFILEVIHRGKTKHHSIPFLLDWFSHDIHMIVKIFNDKYGTLPGISKVFSKPGAVTIFFSDGSLVKFIHEISEISEYKWCFQDGYHFTKINFLDFNTEAGVPELHPIVNMLDKVVRSDSGFSKEKLNQVDSIFSVLVESQLESNCETK
jgi:hypothetical protein